MTNTMPDSRRVLAFYKFSPMSNLEATRTQLELVCERASIKGTILLAEEGVNGTVVGPTDGLNQLAEDLEAIAGTIEFKWSDLDETNPGFHRLKVKIKPEIVSFGVPGLDIGNNGTHVDVERWNELIADPDVVVIDTRNTYEIDIGTFPGAVSPKTTNFREFPAWVEQNLSPEQNPKVAMFCTGGIRCEKASAYMLSQGFDEVFQLDGGILKYLEDSSPEDNQWEGECFVFDQRVSVDKDLGQGRYKQCFACRHPLSEDELADPRYEPGVRCPHCCDRVDEARATRFRQRNKQIKLAAARGEQHIGKTHQPVSRSPKTD